MRRTIRHSHPCADCGAKTPCVGELFDNFDGSPEIACEDFHMIGGTTNPEFVCEGCLWKRDDRATADALENV